MAQPFSSRDDLKRDAFQDSLKKALEWIALHRQTFFSILGTASVAILVLIFIVANFHSLRRQAWEKYSMGQNLTFANQPDNAINSYNEVATNFSHTPAAAYALLAKGDLLQQKKKLPEAIEAYKQSLSKDPPKIVLPFVLSGLAAAQEDSGDYPAAIESYKRLTSEFPDHILTPKGYESLGRVYELSRNADAAKETYEKIITMFPGTIWADKARARYQLLAPQPFQTGTDANALPPNEAPTVQNP